jgi:hypothetical protein
VVGGPRAIPLDDMACTRTRIRVRTAHRSFTALQEQFGLTLESTRTAFAGYAFETRLLIDDVSIEPAYLIGRSSGC